MPIIQLLAPSEARKIAAGEVIERPAHMVKELVENAIDAGATSISLYADHAGKKQLRIIDNGCGMDKDDARTCFLPHATSKITHLHDLETINTFGFRGEALASIAAISKVTLISKRMGDQLGIKITYTEDSVVSEEQIACPPGTEFIIDELFYNTPARKKFLKSDETEWHAIQQTMHAFCFSHPGVHFKLYHNEKLILNAPSVATARDRAAQIWGPDVSSFFVPLTKEKQDNGIYISGFITNHQFWRYGKTHINFFVNNRWVKNTELGKSLLKGYLGVLPPDRFPGALLFFNINQAEIDVNIHPKKEEVRFSKPGILTTVLTNAVKETLSGTVNKRFQNATAQVLEPAFMPTIKPQTLPAYTPWPMTEHKITMPDIFDLEPSALPPLTGRPSTNSGGADSTVQESEQSHLSDNQSLQNYITDKFENPLLLSLSKDASQRWKSGTIQTYRVLGQLMNTYILCAHHNELVIVDQHAAHERILYERRASYFDEAHGSLLLFPERIRLSPQLVQHLLTVQEFFGTQGIHFDALGDNEIAVRSAPPQLRGPSLTTVLTDAAYFIEEHGSLDRAAFNSKFNEHVHSHMACKAAVKAGDQLTQQAMEQLITDLMTVDNRFICVHGRPTLWSIGKQELEKKFRRN